MFTGLIEHVGVVDSVNKTNAGVELRISSEYRDLVHGESIAVNGVCLTVLDFGERWFTVAAMIMTVGRTTVADLRSGSRVNLERAMRADSRFGGHLVQGHVDGVGEVESVAIHGDATLVDIVLPGGLPETLVLHGSVAIDGVSLTVNALQGDKLQVALIDYTLRHTALADISAGGRVNVETDVIGKYVQRLAAPYLKQ
jgi:riboflavin synthase